MTSNPKHLFYTIFKPGYTFISQLKNVQINIEINLNILHDNDIETRNYW